MEELKGKKLLEISKVAKEVAEIFTDNHLFCHSLRTLSIIIPSLKIAASKSEDEPCKYIEFTNELISSFLQMQESFKKIEGALSSNPELINRLEKLCSKIIVN